MHRKVLERFCVKCGVVHDYALPQNWGTQIILSIYVKKMPQKQDQKNKTSKQKKNKNHTTTTIKTPKRQNTRAKLSSVTTHVQYGRATINQ